MVYRYVTRDWSPEAFEGEYCVFTHLPMPANQGQLCGFGWQHRKGGWKVIDHAEALRLAAYEMLPGGIERLAHGLKGGAS